MPETRSQKRKTQEAADELQKRQKVEEEQKFLESKKIDARRLPNDIWQNIGQFIPIIEYSAFLKMVKINTNIMAYQVKTAVWNERNIVHSIARLPTGWPAKEWTHAVYRYARMALKFNEIPIPADLITHILSTSWSVKLTKSIGLITIAIKDHCESKCTISETLSNKINNHLAIFTKQYQVTDNLMLQFAVKTIKTRSLETLPTLDDIKDCIQLCIHGRTGGMYAASLILNMIKNNPAIPQAITFNFIMSYRIHTVQPILNILLSHRPDLINDQMFIAFLAANCTRTCIYMDDRMPASTDASKTDRVDEAIRRNNKVVLNALLEKNYKPDPLLIDTIFVNGNAELARQLLNNNICPAPDILSRMPITMLMTSILHTLLDRRYRLSVRTVTSAVENGNIYALNSLYRYFCTWNSSEKSFEPVLAAIQRRNLPILDYLLNCQWPFPPQNTLISVWKVSFDTEIFGCVYKHILNRNGIIKSTKSTQQPYMLPMTELGEIIIGLGDFNILKILINSGAIQSKDQWIRNLKIRGAVDIIERLQQYEKK